MMEMITQDWYNLLIDDCKNIITEAVHNSRWDLIQGYHQLGERIVTDSEYKKWEQNRAWAVLQRVAKAIGISNRTLYYAIQFYEKYPSLDTVPEGKNISWKKIVTLYLPQPKDNKLDIPIPDGKYRTIVIDPPWPMAKIQREVRPKQIDMDYPVMTIEDIKALPIPKLAFEDGCHIYLWATHKQLPTAFDLFTIWGVNYECLLTWVKNVGITPFSWMYSTEHCLFGRIGNLPLLKLGKRLDFTANVREHSRKPDEFYNLVAEVSPEPRIDFFSREKREGFDQYGNETDKFQ
jgi:N6-adenosine-specific RNA methylase IME4